MVRPITAVLVGYLVMAAWIMATLTLAWKLLGPSFAFHPGTTQVSLGWVAVTLPLSFGLGAVLGGFIAGSIARSRENKAVRALAVIVLVLGLVMAVKDLVSDPAGRDPASDPVVVIEEMSAFEASSEAVRPTWYSFLIPFVGLAGILLGGRLVGKRG